MDAIERGLAYLETRQLEQGGWWVCVSGTPYFEKSELRHDVFTAAFILREIAELSPTWIQPTLDFLNHHRRKDGLWGFYKRGDLHILPMDFDTSSCTGAALALAQPDIDLTAVQEQLNAYRAPQGGYWVYAMPEKAPPGWVFPIMENVQNEHIINAHILVFQAITGIIPPEHLAYLLDILRDKRYEEKQLFYGSNLLFLYNIARAYAYIKQAPPPELLDQAIAYAPGNALGRAYLLKILSVCQPDHPLIPTLTTQLIASQGRDGSWENAVFHRNPILYYGSPEITTAVVLQALNDGTIQQSSKSAY